MAISMLGYKEYLRLQLDDISILGAELPLSMRLLLCRDWRFHNALFVLSVKNFELFVDVVTPSGDHSIKRFRISSISEEGYCSKAIIVNLAFIKFDLGYALY